MTEVAAKVAKNLACLRAEIPPKVKIVAVSKTQPVDRILEAYEAGQRLFGENRALELREKYPRLPQDIEWHYIGYLQTNKVKYIAPFVHLVHSVDRLALLAEIDRAAARHGRVIRCLLQFHIAREETKSGLSLEDAVGMLSSQEFRDFRHTRIDGVMGMATYTEDMGQVREEFRYLKSCFDQLRARFFHTDPGFCEISMGMSGDFRIAIEEGSTMVRIGTAVFGATG